MARTTVSAAVAANRREERPLPQTADAGRRGGFLVGGTFVPLTGTYVSPARAGREEDDKMGFGRFD